MNSSVLRMLSSICFQNVLKPDAIKECKPLKEAAHLLVGLQWLLLTVSGLKLKKC